MFYGYGDVAPKYREAFPRINLVQAEAAFIAGRLVCVFHNEIGIPIGQALLDEVGDDTLTLVYMVQGPGLSLSEGHKKLWFDRVRAGPVAQPRFRCPGCDHRVAILALKDERWQCAACHRLHYRSQLIDELTATAEQVAFLRAMLGQGRPRGMHRSTFERRTAQLAAAKRRMGVEPEASAAHRRIITSAWVEPKDLPELPEQLWLKGYAVCDNAIKRTPEERA